MGEGLDRQKSAVAAGYWPLYRYDPRRAEAGKAALSLDSGEPSLPLADFMAGETRFKVTDNADHAHYGELLKQAEEQMRHRYDALKALAQKDG
jgi:pyruvate-ferredoxin/flavodoxin oxidoreductase